MELNVVSYNEDAGFEILDESLTEQASGGLFIQIGFGGKQVVNNGCVADNNNGTCVQPNAVCATDGFCVEVI